MPTEKLTPKQEKILSEAYSGIEDIIEDLQDLGGVSREFSIALTKLEEAGMWCERGFEVKGYELPDEDDADEDEEGEDDADEEGEDSEEADEK